MKPDAIQSIVTALTPLAQKIGQGGEWVFTLAVKQAYVNGIVDIFVALLCIAAIIFTICLIDTKTTKRKEEGSNYAHAEWDEPGMAWFLGGVIILVPFVILCFCISDSVSALVNPQYYALTHLISDMRGAN